MRAFFVGVGLWILTALAPAVASTYNYDVDIAFSNGTALTGNIVTSCNNCFLTGSNVVAYSFHDNAGGTFLGGGVQTVSNSNLRATSNGIYFVSNSAGNAYMEFGFAEGPLISDVDIRFIWTTDDSLGTISWSDRTNGSGGDLSGQIPPDLQIAQFTTDPSSLVAPAPLSDTLPFLATGLAMLGAFAWRKRALVRRSFSECAASA